MVKGKIEVWKNGNYYVRRDSKGKFIKTEKVTYKTESGYHVYRNNKGRIRSKRRIRIREIPTPPTPPEKGENYRYDVVVRVSYRSKHIGHSRHGEIYGTIISSSQLRDSEIIDICIEDAKGSDKWIDYVEPNEQVIIHIREERTDENETRTISFKETY